MRAAALYRCDHGPPTGQSRFPRSLAPPYDPPPLVVQEPGESDSSFQERRREVTAHLTLDLTPEERVAEIDRALAARTHYRRLREGPLWSLHLAFKDSKRDQKGLSASATELLQRLMREVSQVAIAHRGLHRVCFQVIRQYLSEVSPRDGLDAVWDLQYRVFHAAVTNALWDYEAKDSVHLHLHNGQYHLHNTAVPCPQHFINHGYFWKLTTVEAEDLADSLCDTTQDLTRRLFGTEYFPPLCPENDPVRIRYAGDTPASLRAFRASRAGGGGGGKKRKRGSKGTPRRVRKLRVLRWTSDDESD